MNTLNRLEWLIRTNTRYGGDRFYAVRFQAGEDQRCVEYTEIEKMNRGPVSMICRTLEAICIGYEVVGKDFRIDDGNRKAYYSLLLSLYQTEKRYLGKQRGKSTGISTIRGNYRGRTPIWIDDTRLIEVAAKFQNHKLTAQDAAAVLGVSRSTFFRKLKTIT